VADKKDVQDSQTNRFGPINARVKQLNRDRDFTGVRGYPSDKEYMKDVADSNLERDKTAMRGQGFEEAAKVGKKIPSYKKGGKIRKTGLALVHKGERMIPKGKVARVEKVMKARKRG
jgi:hypothetical protein